MLSFRLLLTPVLLIASVTIYCQRVQLINSAVVIEEGSKLHDEGKYREAIKVYDLITSADSNYVLSLYEKALSAQADSSFQQALVYCEQALNMKADREREPQLYNLYANIFDRMQNRQRAMAIYDSAIRKYPAYTPLYVDKAISFINTKEYDKAEDVIRKALLQDPYSPSPHYYYGIISVNKGNLVPAILAYCTYLMTAPNGRNTKNVIDALGVFSKNAGSAADNVIQKRTGDAPPTYQEIEQIIISKIALDKNYKIITALDDPISRQLQVLLEKIEYDAESEDFAMQYYVPLYKKLFSDKHFEPFINYIFSSADLDQIKNYNKRNKKEVQAFIDAAALYLNSIRSTRELNPAKRENPGKRYYFDDGKLTSYGAIVNEHMIGTWTFYFPAGNIKAVGEYNSEGNKNGLWKYYYFNGMTDGEENVVNGTLQGNSTYYYDNGKLMLKCVHQNGKKEGGFKRYFKGGSLNSVGTYSNEMLTGNKKTYFESGNLSVDENYKDDKMEGPFVTYYSNGNKEKVGIMQNDKLNGSYVYYYESGAKAIEGQYEKGNSVGSWTYYHKNGKKKSQENYVNTLVEGDYLEYHDNDQLSLKCKFRKGKLHGEAFYYDNDGKLYSTILYDNDKIKWAKYFDKTGKQISSSEANSKGLHLVAISASGRKVVETDYNDKGLMHGNRTFYFSSGNVKETYTYKDGEIEGMNVEYYPDKSKRTELEFHNGKKDGYFSSYYRAGQKKSEGWYVDDEAQGTWIFYYGNSNISSKGEYLNDKLNGVTYYYWPDGRKKNDDIYEDGLFTGITQYDTAGKVINVADLGDGNKTITLKNINGKKEIELTYRNYYLQGERKEYYFDGSIKSLSYYKNGLEDSIYKIYYHGGILATEGRYSMGKKTGEWKEYNDKGKISSVKTYLNDELHGKKITYHDNGKVHTESEMQDGENHGVFKRFSNTGELMIQINYQRDNPQSYTYLDKNNALVPAIPMNDGNTKVVAYYPNGNKSVEFELVDGRLINNDNRYHSNGKPSMESRESYDETEGEVKYYYPDGKLRSSTTYLHNQENGPYRSYHPNGKLEREGNYVLGLAHGILKKYDVNGRLTQTQIYFYDNLIDVRK
jgi:uncharacterized protein